MIAAITSCTNTSNPQVMVAAGLLAQKALARGLQRKPWVKSSLAPGSKVVTKYYEQAGLQAPLDELGFNTVGYGCTTCIGNSGPLADEISTAIADGNLVVCSVLSGNRNFEARIHPEVKANYLASPPLVVAYALAGRMDIDWAIEPIGQDTNGDDVFLHDIWPSSKEVSDTIASSVRAEQFADTYSDVFSGDDEWRALDVPEGELFAWAPDSTYVRHPPYFEGMPREPVEVADIEGARLLVWLGDSVTTDHISPAGSIKPDSPAGTYLVEHGVERRDFNSYGARRGNHEVMVRGTFANVRLRNQLVPDTEGTWTVHIPSGEEMTIFEASERYIAEGTPTIVIAGKEYGSGSSRDWAAKGPNLLGVKAVIAESYERIHKQKPHRWVSRDPLHRRGQTAGEVMADDDERDEAEAQEQQRLEHVDQHCPAQPAEEDVAHHDQRDDRAADLVIDVAVGEGFQDRTAADDADDQVGEHHRRGERKMNVPMCEHSQRSRKNCDLGHVPEPLAHRPEAGADEEQGERDDQRRRRGHHPEHADAHAVRHPGASDDGEGGHVRGEQRQEEDDRPDRAAGEEEVFTRLLAPAEREDADVEHHRQVNENRGSGNEPVHRLMALRRRESLSSYFSRCVGHA